MKNNFPPIKWHSFFFGHCPEESLSQTIATAEELGCEFLQAIPGMVLVQPSILAPPGTQAIKTPVFKILVRIPAGEVEAFNARCKAFNAAAVAKGND